MTVLLDYGMGNLRSVERAFAAIGESVSIQSHLGGATRLIIPGVGAFASAMERLAPLASEICGFAQSGGPLLGICLGQQLLFESSEENPTGGHAEWKGLGLLGGRVRYLPKTDLKVPHVGWNTAEFVESSPLGSGEPAMYYVHSLYADASDASDVTAWTEYGIRFAGAVHRGSIWGTQFHPEKSGPAGLELLRRFAAC